MVIQSNMSPKSIVDVWSDTGEVFKRFGVVISEEPLIRLAEEGLLAELLMELNKAAGSSDVTCVAGG